MNIVGTWNWYFNFDGSGNYNQTTLTISGDGTWSNAFGEVGTWMLVGNLFTLARDSGYTYTGLFAGGVVCGYNGSAGAPNPPTTAFYLVNQANTIAALSNAIAKTEK